MKQLIPLRRGLIGLLALALVLALGAPLAFAQDAEARTFTDALGREVTLEAPPQRVVGLSASIIDVFVRARRHPGGRHRGH